MNAGLHAQVITFTMPTLFMIGKLRMFGPLMVSRNGIVITHMI